MKNTPQMKALFSVVAGAMVGFSSAHAATLITASNFLNHDSEVARNALEPENVTSSYTVSSAVNSPLLVVGIAVEGNEGYDVTGVTFGAQSFAAGPKIYLEDGTNDGFMSLFYLTNPITDTGAAITVTTNSSTYDATDDMVLTAFTLSNVNQTNPLGDTITYAANDNAPTPTAPDNPSVDLTTQGADSLLLMFAMNGQSISRYSVDSPGSLIAPASFDGGNNGLGLQVASWEGGASGTTSSLSLSGDSIRIALVGAEFQAIPEPSSFILVGVAGLAGLMVYSRRK